MRGACGVSKRDGESNEDMYGRFGMSEAAVGMDCEVVERTEKEWIGRGGDPSAMAIPLWGRFRRE